MITSKVMETRKRFQEIYGQHSEEKDYGSMENFANAHREYLKNVHEQYRVNEQYRENDAIQWMELLRTGIAAGSTTENAVPYQPLPPQAPIGSVPFEAASFLRRLLAEFLDFVVLLGFKLCVVGVLVEFDVIDLKAFGSSLEEDQDVMQFINLAQELFPVELVCKIFCCFLEGIIMATGLGPIGVGQTPGKWMCGTRVISCLDVVAGEGPDQIIVESPDLLSWQQSIKRSLMKNLIVNSLFPFSTAAFQIHNGRVMYDVVAKTVVVMDH